MKGIDIYEGDNIQDWNAVKNQGIEVVIQKATQSTTHIDKLLQYRYPRIKAAGLKIGFYHFAQYNSTNTVAEAQFFLSAINSLQSDTVLWLDIEAEEKWDKQTAINYANAFIKYVQSQGKPIGIYTGDSFYHDYLEDNIPDVPLWLASYGKQPSLYPSNASWQYSESGSLDGIVGNVDLDYFIDNIFITSSNLIKEVQHDLQRVSCLEEGESNATGVLDVKTLNAIATFKDAAGVPGGVRGDGYLIDALNVITHKPTVGEGWNVNPIAIRFLQWYFGLPRTGVVDSTMTAKLKEWQVKVGIWSTQGADGVIREKDWSKILK